MLLLRFDGRWEERPARGGLLPVSLLLWFRLSFSRRCTVLRPPERRSVPNGTRTTVGDSGEPHPAEPAELGGEAAGVMPAAAGPAADTAEIGRVSSAGCEGPAPSLRREATGEMLGGAAAPPARGGGDDACSAAAAAGENAAAWPGEAASAADRTVDSKGLLGLERMVGLVDVRAAEKK